MRQVKNKSREKNIGTPAKNPLNMQFPCMVLACGPSECGKSHLIKYLLRTNHDQFDYVVAFSDTTFDGDYDWLPEDMCFPEVTNQRLLAIMKKHKENRNLHACII